MDESTAQEAAAALRTALAGVRALLLDLDGVIVVAGAAVPGAMDALAALDRLRVPYRIVTNTSAVSRATLARWAAALGTPVPASRFQSALSATAAWTARVYPDAPLYVMASEDARSEFAGQRLLSHEEAGARGAVAAAVVIGDSPEEVTFDNMNRAFRLVIGGAKLVGMHQNPWWLTPDGPTLDSGAFVAGILADGPADDVGIGRGDVIVAVDGQAVRSPDDLGAVLDGSAPGDRVSIELVESGGDTRTVEVELTARPLPVDIP